MYKTSLKPSALFIAVNAILFTTAAYAEDIQTDDMPTVTLSAITVTAEADSYTSESSTSTTGLDLEFKENPKSTTVITEQRMQDQQLSDIASIVKNTSGLSTLNFDGGRTEFHARGFEVDAFEVDGLPVKYGTYIERPEFGSTAIYEQAEVVKGANGLMSGSGNPSATVNMVRKHADSSDFAGEVSLSADKFGTYGTTIDVGSALNANGTVRGRVVLDYADGDTYVDRESKKRQTAYAVVDADITDNTVISVGAAYKEGMKNSTMWGGLPMYYTDGDKPNWDVSDSTGVDWENWNDTTTEYFATVEHGFNNDWKIKLNANHAKTEGDSKLFSIYGSAMDRETGTSDQYSMQWISDADNTTVSGEISGHFDTFGNDSEVLLGASYSKHESTALGRGDLTETPATNLESWDGSYPEPKWSETTPQTKEKTEENAIYASTKINVIEPLSVIVGSRVSNYRSQGDSYGYPYDIEHNSVWTPFLGLTYKVNNNISLFGSYTDVFNPQTERDVKGEYLEPIVGNNIEVGLKGNNDADSLQAQFSVFSIKQDNLAQEDGDKLVPGTAEPDWDWPGDQAYLEAEGATSKGIDVEISGKLTDNMTSSIGYTHFVAEDVDGKELNTKNPNTLLKLFTTYDMQNYVSGLTVGGGINWSNQRHSIETNPATELEEKYSTDAFTNVSLMAKYEYNDNMDIQLNIDNLLNQQRIQSFQYNTITFAEPMNVKGKVTYRW